jgi:uncharacterized protein (TIRG00374 family)
VNPSEPATPSATGGASSSRPGPTAWPGRLRTFGKRAVLLAVTGIGIYIVWPSLMTSLSAWPSLLDLDLRWYPVALALEAGSFVCIWALTRLSLRTKAWFPVATAQLASNAFGKIVPGGAAAGGALQYQMLTRGGVESTTVATGLTAVGLLTTAALLALPVLSLPAIIAGVPVRQGLARAAWLGAAVFVGLVALGTALLTTERLLRAIGRLVEWLQNRFRRSKPPRTGVPERLVRERDLIRESLGRRWWLALLMAAGNVGLDYLALLATLVAVGARPRASLVILAYVAAAVLGMIPITPGGLGFVEAGLTGTLTLAGVPAAQAVLATLAYRLAAYWLPLVAGGVAYGLFTRRYGRARRAFEAPSPP